MQIKNFRPSGSGYSSPSGWRGDLPKLRRTTCRTSEIRKRESHRPRSNWGARLPHPIPFHRLCVSAGRRRRWYRCICCFRNSTSHFKQAASSGRPQQWHLTIRSSRPCFATRLNSGVRCFDQFQRLTWFYPLNSSLNVTRPCPRFNRQLSATKAHLLCIAFFGAEASRYARHFFSPTGQWFHCSDSLGDYAWHYLCTLASCLIPTNQRHPP